MILTEDKIYTMSLETESVNRDSGLTNNAIELEFTNKELLHAIVTCGMPIQRLTAAFPEKKRFEFLYKLFLVETALDAEGDRLKNQRRSHIWILLKECDFLLYGNVFYKDDQSPTVWI